MKGLILVTAKFKSNKSKGIWIEMIIMVREMDKIRREEERMIIRKQMKKIKMKQLKKMNPDKSWTLKV